MSKLNYPFDFEKSRKKNREARNVRLVVIATLIAIVTFGVIWYFLPSNEKPPVEIEELSTEKSLNEIDNSLKTEDIPPFTGDILEETTPSKSSTTIEVADNNQLIDTEEPQEPLESINSATPPEKGQPHASDPTYDEPYIAPDAVDDQRFATVLNNLQKLYSAQEYSKVQAQGKTMLTSLTVNSAQWRTVAKILGEANIKIFLSGSRDGKSFYTVASGDSLYHIAKKYGISIDALRKMNKIPNDKDVLLIGEKLVVSEANWHIVVEKQPRLLKLYNGDKLFSVYDIGIGRLGRTPVGEFKIGDRIKDPEYRSSDGRIIAPGAPENELGRYFLKLFSLKGSVSEGYGIHGTADESSVSRSLSNGCIRMRNAEIEELFSIVPNGTIVKIEE